MGKETTHKKKFKFIPSPTQGQRGTVIVYVGVLIIVLLGFGALAVDIGHLYVARNELQDAADAGALAGAGRLYLKVDPWVGWVNDGQGGIPSANQFAYNAATANTSQNQPVEVQWSGGNAGDIQRGHWRFRPGAVGGGVFTASENTSPPVLAGRTAQELNDDLNFVNAVRVVARRQGTPVAMAFAGIFGSPTFGVAAEAVAYIGFAGTLRPFEINEPIAICEQSILNYNPNDPNAEYTCTVGRMINSDPNRLTTSNTGGWTNFSQGDNCHTANANEIKNLINPPQTPCQSGNPGPLTLNSPMGAQGGQDMGPALGSLINCWQTKATDSNGDGIPDAPWEITLPVVSCPGNNLSNTCDEVTGALLKGAVTVNVVWITGTGDDPNYNNIPKYFNYNDGTTNVAYSCNASDKIGRQACWNDFANKLNLKDVDNNPAAYNKMSIYFRPSCKPEIPRGTTGGSDFGILAKTPVLVYPDPH